MISEELLGRLVISKSGRDKGKVFVVIKVLGHQQVLISDGDYRAIENPKKKNLKHLQLTNHQVENLVELLKREIMPANHIIKKGIWQAWEKAE